MSYPKAADRFTLGELDIGFCTGCREFVCPDEGDEVCPFCALEVTDYGSIIDAVCDSELAEELHGSS